MENQFNTQEDKDLIHDKLKEVFAIARNLTNGFGEGGSVLEGLGKDCSDEFVEECMKLLKLQ